MTRILIADDHAVVRRGLKEILAEGYPHSEIHEANSGAAALDLLTRGGPWDLVILDINIPDKSGLQILDELRAHGHKVPVLILSMHPEEQFAIRALKAGASGYLNKDSAAEELLRASQELLAGNKYVSPKLAAGLAEGMAGSRRSVAALSEREDAVLRMLYEGHPIKEIAARLDLSPKTVSTYRHRLLTKLGLKSNAELVQYVLTHQLLS